MKTFAHIARKALPAAAALLLFFTLAALYFAPQFAGDVLPQHDVMQYKAVMQETYHAREAYGEDPQWTGSMFGGMPSYLISVEYPAQFVKHSAQHLTDLVDTPAGFLFFAMAGMWLMLLMIGVNPWVGIVGAVMYGLSTYFLLIIGAGHVTKMWALVYAPPMMGGIWMTLRGRMWRGAVLTALFTALEVGANHPQITYYFLMAAAALWINDLAGALRSRTLRAFARRTVAVVGAGLLGVGANFAPLWYTARYTPHTIRGGSEVASPQTQAAPEGLDLDYATAWSYGRAESWTLLIPDFMGGDSARTFAPDGEVAEAMRPYGLEQVARQLPAYWGDQPYTAGPTYLGAVAILLAVMALVVLPGRDKWWIAALCGVMLLLAWGRHFMGLTELFFRFVPGYDKFRTVSMTLVVVQWAVPLLGALTLQRLWEGSIGSPRMRRAVKWGAGITGGACLLFLLAGGALFDFGREESVRTMTAQFHDLLAASGGEEALRQGIDAELGQAAGNAMADERAGMMRADAERSLLYILLASAAIGLYAWRRYPRWALAGIVGVLAATDLWTADRRWLNDDSFVPASRERIEPTAADRTILADTTPGFRVLNRTVSPFNDATTSYFHRSVGGYHGAKLSRYQDLIDRYLSQGDERILDLLNTRYVIEFGRDRQPEARRRPTAYGAAWFVSDIALADTPRDELEALGRTDLRRTAVLSVRDAAAAEMSRDFAEGEGVAPDPAGEGAAAGSAAGTEPAPDSAAANGPDTFEPAAPTSGDAPVAQGRIALTEYRPNRLTYVSSTPEAAVAVFSEIFYDEGWRVFVDGEEAPCFRADYLLRAMWLPAGEHTVEWRFRAPGWGWTEGITLACSLAVLLGILAWIGYEGRQKIKA